FPGALCWASTPSPPFPTVVCVSEWAHAFGSSCSALGATGALASGGAWASAKAGRRATEAVSPKIRISRNIRRILFRYVGRITACRERGFHSRRGVAQALKADQRKMAERRHRPMLDEPHAAVARGPLSKPAEAKFGPPTESSRDRSEAQLKYATRAVLRADMVDEHDLATRPGDANEFAQRGLGFG